MKVALAALSPAEFTAAGNAAAEKLRRSPFWQNNDTVLLFLSMAGEIDTSPLLEAAFLDKKTVYLPKIEEEQGGSIGQSMRFYRVFSAAPEKGWETGAFNIREPAATEAFCPSCSPFLVVTPGLAFDQSGGRLGRGRAFYDRFFAALAVSDTTSAFTARDAIPPISKHEPGGNTLRVSKHEPGGNTLRVSKHEPGGNTLRVTYAACGICLRCQLVGHVPTDARDKRMDAVFTG
jgi:5-formyltetrahydrofolate cyclo-ligase